MITLKQWMEIVDYKITEGNEYSWSCWPNAYSLDYWNGDHDGHSLTITFNTKTQEVYSAEIHDYANSRAYRLINPDWAKAHKKMAKNRGVGADEAWDDVDYQDLETDEDWLAKAAAVVAGQDYDTRVQVPVNFTDEELLQYMKLAHEMDITFNQLVERAILEFIKSNENTTGQ